jgi:hypothetical protein
MSKAKIRAAVRGAIQSSDESDVASLARGEYDFRDRRWARASTFLAVLAACLECVDAVAAQEISEFHDRVISHENPLNDAGPEGKSK